MPKPKTAKYEPIQLIKKHISNCAYLNGLNPGSPWCMPKQVTDWSFSTRNVGRDLSGRKNSKARHTWLVFRCGDTSCHAELAVYFEHVVFQLDLESEDWKLAEETSR